MVSCRHLKVKIGAKEENTIENIEEKSRQKEIYLNKDKESAEVGSSHGLENRSTAKSVIVRCYHSPPNSYTLWKKT